MKTNLQFKKRVLLLAILFSTGIFIQQKADAQILSFKSPVKISGAALSKGAEYRFSDVSNNVDAIVKIEDLVNGAEVRQIDQTGVGPSAVGYEDAFQPLVYTPGGTRTAYALFSIKFVQKGSTTSLVDIGDFSATSLDIDGNATLKEFSEISMSGNSGIMSYLTSTVQIAVNPILGGYNGLNIAGIEYSGIDTSALATMYTVKRTTVNAFTLKFGAVTIASSSASRQYSLYMKDFSYALNTLPVKLTSFSAVLNNGKADLKWRTSSEINVSHFVVEKSTDGINFTEAGTVFAYGNTSEVSNYAFSDNLNNIQSVVIYYRLRSVDNDQKSQLSEVRIIRISKQVDNSISIVTYPNPASNELRITVPSEWQNSRLIFEMYSANGILVNRMEKMNSSQTETMNVSNLTAGTYFVIVKNNGVAARQKIIKQ